MPRFDECMSFVLQWEGGFVDDPDDAGGATNQGITQAVYDKWRSNHELPYQSVRNLAAWERDSIYRELYWDRIAGEMLPAPVDLVVFDAAVNSGVSRASKWLQRLVDAADDGVIGDQTLKLVAQCDAYELAAAFCEVRQDFIFDIVARKPSQKKFLKGWTRRIEAVRDEAAST